MDKLSTDWLTEGIIDFEYKKYIVLAYLKQIGRKFGNVHLYPSLSDLIAHRENLLQFKEKKTSIWSHFPKKINHEAAKRLKLDFEKEMSDDKVLQELEAIIAFSMPRFTKMIEEGKEIYEFVEEQMALEPVGIIPIYIDEGYLFINHDSQRDISIYQYKSSVFESAKEKYRGINLRFLANDFIDFSRSFERVKLELAREHADLPNPATFSLVTKMAFPEQPTILPVAKRILMRHLSTAA